MHPPPENTKIHAVYYYSLLFAVFQGKRFSSDPLRRGFMQERRGIPAPSTPSTLWLRSGQARVLRENAVNEHQIAAANSNNIIDMTTLEKVIFDHIKYLA